MKALNEACQTIVATVDGALACGIVDLPSGDMIARATAGAYSTEYTLEIEGERKDIFDVVAAATVDLFRGDNVGMIEQDVRAHRGVPENGEHYLEEVFMSSKYLYHFGKVIANGETVIMLVTRNTANLGLGWARLKGALPTIEPLVLRYHQTH